MFVFLCVKALQHRGIDVANDLNDDNFYDEMTSDYDDYDYYINNALDADEEELDSYYDEDEFVDDWFDENHGEEWVVMADDEQLDDAIMSEADWQNDDFWDLMEKTVTRSGKTVQKKCMNIFGRQLCLCQFEDWIQSGTLKKQCGPKMEQKIVRPPKNKPSWMPEAYWKHLMNAKDPHKIPNEVKRKKMKLALKLKKKYNDDKYMKKKKKNDIKKGIIAKTKKKKKMKEEKPMKHGDSKKNPSFLAVSDDYGSDYMDDEEILYDIDELFGENDDENDDIDDNEEYVDNLKDFVAAQYEEYGDALSYYDKLDDDQDYDDDDDDDDYDALLFDELLDDEYDDYETYSNALDKLLASYQYDDEFEDIESDEFAEYAVSDWWINDDDDAEWIVTAQSMNGQFDDIWLDDTEWEQINKRIRTKSGHLMTRKCLKSMCLCKFSDDLKNGKKFKCMPRTEAIDDDYDNAAAIDDDEFDYYYDNGMFLLSENYDEYDNDNDNVVMNVNAKLMFADDSLWDTVYDDGSEFIKKCKNILGINWCYCRSRETAWPWPCFGLPFKLKKEANIAHIGKRLQPSKLLKYKQLLTQTG